MSLFQFRLGKVCGDAGCNGLQVDVSAIRDNPATSSTTSSSSAPANSSPPPSSKDLVPEKLTSVQLFKYSSYLINIFKINPAPVVVGILDHKEAAAAPLDEAVGKSQRPKHSGDKILELLHFAGEAPNYGSRQEVNTTLSSGTVIVDGEYVKTKSNNKALPKGLSTKINSQKNNNNSSSSLIKTIIVNLEDWNTNHLVAFNVSTNDTHTGPNSKVATVPFLDEGVKQDSPNAYSVVNAIFNFFEDPEVSSSPETTTGASHEKPGKSAEPSKELEGKQQQEPFRIQLSVANTLSVVIEGFTSKLFAHELNNNQDNVGISSTKALLEKRHCPDLSENALTDDGIPLVPTSKEIIRELIRERLKSLKMDPSDINTFFNSRDSEFLCQRSLSGRLAHLTRPEVPAEPLAPLSAITFGTLTSAGFQARYETLMHHATSLSAIINSATASVIESSISYILPHITLTYLGSRKLSHLGPSLVDDWLEVAYTAAFQLKPNEPIVVTPLVEREMKEITKGAERWLKVATKSLGKMRKLRGSALKCYRKAALPKVPHHDLESSPSQGGSVFPIQKTDVGYSSFLQKIGVSSKNLYPSHLYLSVSKYGLMLKRNLNDAWFQFDSLSYAERRGIFLGLMEHMMEMLRNVTAVAQQVQELHIQGYPANVYNHLKTVFQLSAELSSGSDVPDEFTANVLKRTKAIVQAFSRLVAVVAEVRTMAKTTYGKFNASYYDPVEAQRFKSKLIDQKAARVQLIIPFKYMSSDGLTSLKFRGEHPVEETSRRTTRHGKASSNADVPSEREKKT